MSRTYKDRPNRFKYDPWDQDTLREKCVSNDGYTLFYTIYLKTTKPKKKKSVNTEWHWMKSTPSWFIREFMTVPKRAACRNWEKTLTLGNLEEADCPDYGRKPYIYYW